MMSDVGVNSLISDAGDMLGDSEDDGLENRKEEGEYDEVVVTIEPSEVDVTEADGTGTPVRSDSSKW